MSANAAQACQKIVGELLETRIADLGDRRHTEVKLAELDRAVREIQAFAQSIQSLLGNFVPARRGPGRPRKDAASLPAAAQPQPAARSAARLKPAPSRRGPGRPRRSGHRGPGDFPAKQFVFEAVRGAGSAGIRPRDIVEQVVAAAPGRHVRPSALVSTILARLKREGQVKSRAGNWKAA